MKRSLQTALTVSGMVILSAVILNRFTSPFPWSMYPIFGILWWPLSVYFHGRREPLHFAVYGTVLLFLLFLLTYLFASPGAHPWFLYPMLGVFWWPLSVWGSLVGARRFSVTGATYVVLTLVLINLLTSPGHWWWMYPSFFILWWPLGVYLHRRGREEGEAE